MSDAASIVIREATAGDADALGRLGAALTRLHHAFDADRFITPAPNLEEKYGRFLVSHIASDESVVLVAERASAIVGYVWAGIEPKSYKELRDTAGFVHDVFVAEDARGTGTGERLVEAAAAWLIARGMPRVMLWTADKNDHAQRLFERLGFRRTMIEMTREAKS